MFNKTYTQALGEMITSYGTFSCGEMMLQSGNPDTWTTHHKLPVGLRGLLSQEIATQAAIETSTCDGYLLRGREIAKEIVEKMTGTIIFSGDIVAEIENLIALEKQASDMYCAAKDASRA